MEKKDSLLHTYTRLRITKRKFFSFLLLSYNHIIVLFIIVLVLWNISVAFYMPNIFKSYNSPFYSSNSLISLPRCCCCCCCSGSPQICTDPVRCTVCTTQTTSHIHHPFDFMFPTSESIFVWLGWRGGEARRQVDVSLVCLYFQFPSKCEKMLASPQLQFHICLHVIRWAAILFSTTIATPNNTACSHCEWAIQWFYLLTEWKLFASIVWIQYRNASAHMVQVVIWKQILQQQ